MKAFALATAFALSTTAAFAANPEVGGAPMLEDKNIVENAVNSKDHTTLVAAVRRRSGGNPVRPRPLHGLCPHQCRL